MNAAPIVIICRKKTGCRQYPFFSQADLARWLRRKPYCAEVITAIFLTKFGGEMYRVTGHAVDFLAEVEAAQ